VLDWLMSLPVPGQEKMGGERDEGNPGLDSQRIDRNAIAAKELPPAHAPSPAGRTDRPILVPVSDAAKLLGLSNSEAYELVKAGVIPSVRLGERCIRVPVDKLRETMNRMAEQGGPGFYRNP